MGLLAAAAFLNGCNKKPASTEILIGEYGAMTGSTATFGQSTHMGMAMAVAEINATGGIAHRNLRLITEDDEGKPEEAQTVVTKLINKDRVVAVVGDVASSNSLAAAPVCQQNHIPMITPASTNPKVTQVGDYIFRVCFTDPFQGRVMAKFARDSLRLSRVAIFRDIKSDYSMGLADNFKRSFTAAGGTILSDESYSAGDKDFSAQLTSLKQLNPEAIFIPGYYTEVGLIARQARTLGLNSFLLGGDGWDSDKLWEIGGEALNGSYFSNHYSMDNPSEEVQGFVKDFRTRWDGKEPDAMAALGYDAIQILADALRRGGTNPDSLRLALGQTNGFMGVTGVITLDGNRDAVKSAVVLQVHDGRFAYRGTVQP